jgi:hypothetical protein
MAAKASTELLREGARRITTPFSACVETAWGESLTFGLACALLAAGVDCVSLLPTFGTYQRKYRNIA